MTPSNVPFDTGDQPAFACAWRPDGVDAATVTATGTIDLASMPLLETALARAAEHARLLLIDLDGASFADADAAVAIGAAAARASQEGARVVVVGAPPSLRAALNAAGVDGQVEVLDLAPPGTRRSQRLTASGSTEPRIRPFDNPVNASVLSAQAMAVARQALWFEGEDGSVGRAWAPPGGDLTVETGSPVEVYMDGRGEVNGWRHPMSGLAVNQRLFDPAVAAEPSVAACHGPCGVLWQAPAATRLTESGERCLTCSGPLVLR